MDPGKYSSDPEYSDLTPIPLNDGTPTPDTENADPDILPLASIAYAPEYLEATSYLRAVMAANEMSDRALRLTEDVIAMNPAHYTVWIYRAKILFALEKDLLEELDWLNGVSLRFLKNYQIWHHRQTLLSSTKHFPTLPAEEPSFLMEMFNQDNKNYHVWSYRHWLVRHFGLWDSPREIEDVDRLLRDDVRNNSAWNHRFMLRFGPRDGELDAGVPGGKTGKAAVVDEEVVDGELEFAREMILKAPLNRSPWSYARGVLGVSGRGLGEWKGFVEGFVGDGDGREVVKSTHALEWLVDVYLEEDDRKGEAKRLLTLLKDKYDPVRRNYWDYRIQMVAA